MKAYRAAWLATFGLLAAAALAAGAVERNEASPADVESAQRKLAILEARRGAPAAGKIVVTESELNAYLGTLLKPKLPAGLSDLLVHLDRDRLTATGVVDVDRVREHVKSDATLNPLALLGGRIPVELRGKLVSRDGFGTIELEHARLGPALLPVAIVEQLVRTSTRSARLPEGYDLRSPFRLPWALKRIRLEAGRALLEH